MGYKFNPFTGGLDTVNREGYIEGNLDVTGDLTVTGLLSATGTVQGVQGVQGTQGIQGISVQGVQGTTGIQGSVPDGTEASFADVFTTTAYTVDVESGAGLGSLVRIGDVVTLFSGETSEDMTFNNGTVTVSTKPLSAVYIFTLSMAGVKLQSTAADIQIGVGVNGQSPQPGSFATIAGFTTTARSLIATGVVTLTAEGPNTVDIYVQKVAGGAAGANTYSFSSTQLTLLKPSGFIRGTQGIQGVQGVQGPQGVQGLDGEFAGQGIQGIQGETGIQGNQGVQGISVQGSQGIQGEVGAQGVQGIQGETGIQGLDGEFAGQGIQGIQGEAGPQGAQGVQGIQGETGIQGSIPDGTLPSFTDVYALSSFTTDLGIGVGEGSVIKVANNALVQGETTEDITFSDSTITVGSKPLSAAYMFVLTIGALKAESTTCDIQFGVGVNGQAPLLGNFSRVNGFSQTAREMTASGIVTLSGDGPNTVEIYVQKLTTGNGTSNGITFQSVQLTLHKPSGFIQGVQGLVGIQGVQGVLGIQGLDGEFAGQGIQGVQGIQGETGIQGLDGEFAGQGIQGFDGPQGIFGLQGIQGLDGTTPFVEASGNIVYSDPTFESSTVDLSTVDNLIILTQVTYNALSIKNPSTVYFIVSA